MNKPNFFIVGAPKCGTTALSTYLGSHPDVFFAEEKEPHFFSTDMPDYTKTHDLDKYLKNFESDSANVKCIGEGSTWYMFSKVAIENILEFNDEAKIIAMVRNPIDMAESLYYQFLLGFEENANTFEEAWGLQESRSLGKNIPKMNTPVRLQYKEVCSLGSQLQRLVDAVPANQLKIILFDDFITDTRKVYNEVLTFLEIPENNDVEFSRVNESSKPRFPLLAKLSHQSTDVFDPYVKFIKKIFGIKRVGLTRYLKKVNKKKNTKALLSESFKTELYEKFKSEIALIEKILDRDLSHWHKR